MEITNNTYQINTAEDALHNAEKAYQILQGLSDYLCDSECDWLHDIGRAFRFLYTFPLLLAISSLEATIVGECPEHKAGSLAFPAATYTSRASEILRRMDSVQKKS